MSAPQTWEVIAIRYGQATLPRSALFHHYGVYGEPDRPQDMAYYLYVLRSGGRTLLVDTGFRPETVAPRPGRSGIVEPPEALARLGIEPGAVSEILVTHFHWDHTGNLRRFPHAALVVPEAEVEFWGSPVARHAPFWSHVDGDDVALLLGAHRDGRARPTGADTTVAPGVRAITVGGHSPGQQVLVVETASGPVVLTSDAVHLYEELELGRPFGIVVDLREMYAAYELVRGFEREGAVVVPGHDPEVLRRFPAVEGDASPFAARIA
jgi:glyoxylase-like metal-dependent hydrolase (beta-lactamase superfamily II)